MADPLSITASVVAVVTAAIHSTKSLRETVQRYKDRNKTLRRLLEQLEDLLNTLNTLQDVSNLESPMLSLLKGPVSRCSEVCRDFEATMKVFTAKSTTGFRDWTKMEFMRGDINEFMDALMGYKSTIAVGLGTITMHTSKLSHQVLEEYNEMIKDTAYNLQLQLQRIDEKVTRFSGESTRSSGTGIDLEDERAVTKQCLLICEDARSYLESLTDKEPFVRHPTASESATAPDQFEAQLLTRQALDDNRDSFAEMIGRLRERLDTLTRDTTSTNDQEKRRMEEELEISKQCLEVCKRASNEASQQKTYKIGEAIADGDSDQVLVTTLADLFDVKKATSRGRSAQLLGFMTDETLQKVSKDRYNSRFGAVTSGDADGVTLPSPPNSQIASTERARTGPQVGRNTAQAGTGVRHSRPSPNEMRKRTGEGGGTDE